MGQRAQDTHSALSHNMFAKRTPLSTTMSDLAPFVAAALRDKVTTELIQEVKALSEEKRVLESFQITASHKPKQVPILFYRYPASIIFDISQNLDAIACISK